MLEINSIILQSTVILYIGGDELIWAKVSVNRYGVNLSCILLSGREWVKAVKSTGKENQLMIRKKCIEKYLHIFSQLSTVAQLVQIWADGDSIWLSSQFCTQHEHGSARLLRKGRKHYSFLKKKAGIHRHPTGKGFQEDLNQQCLTTVFFSSHFETQPFHFTEIYCCWDICFNPTQNQTMLILNTLKTFLSSIFCQNICISFLGFKICEFYGNLNLIIFFFHSINYFRCFFFLHSVAAVQERLKNFNLLSRFSNNLLMP